MIMKATDLMIDDWVIRRGVPEEPMRLYDMKASSGIAYLDQDGRGIAEKFENIEPIPITPEILEKNGCVCVEVGDNGHGTPQKFRNRYEKWECRTQWHTFHIFSDRITRLYSMNAHSFHIGGMQYVHELQHALQLCKIENEIVL